MNVFAFLGISCISSCIAQISTQQLSQNISTDSLLNVSGQTIRSQLAGNTNLSPAILQNVSKAVQKQLQQIIGNGSLTLAAVEKKVKEWLKSQDSQVQVTFAKSVIFKKFPKMYRC